MLTYILLLFFSLAPSFIWLLFFLGKDHHPESKRMILKIFFYGMLIAAPVALLELGFTDNLKVLNLPPVLAKIIYVFVGIALIEELLKYFVVRWRVFDHREFDEPVDTMLYMIIAALGFAAMENILIFLPLNLDFHLMDTFLMSVLRFLGATFLHALCSGLLGYYLALSFRYTKNRFKLAAKGMIIATFLHGLYDFSIMEIEGNLKFLLPLAILFGLAVFVSWGFRNIKTFKGVCLPDGN
jgi:RsiW-degrading membrane proteinase PrsW (M82 family)